MMIEATQQASPSTLLSQPMPAYRAVPFGGEQARGMPFATRGDAEDHLIEAHTGGRVINSVGYTVSLVVGSRVIRATGADCTEPAWLKDVLLGNPLDDDAAFGVPSTMH